MKRLVRRFPAFCLVFLVWFCWVGLASADTYGYYIPISVFNNSATTYSYLPVIIPMNNTQLSVLGYINASGLDTRVVGGATQDKYSLTTGNVVEIVPSMLGSQTVSSQYRLDYDPPYTMYPLSPGYGGYITTADSSTLESGPAGTFTYNITGYVKSSVAGSSNYLSYKSATFSSYVDANSNLSVNLEYGPVSSNTTYASAEDAYLYTGGSSYSDSRDATTSSSSNSSSTLYLGQARVSNNVSETTGASSDPLYNGSTTRVAQRFDNFEGTLYSVTLRYFSKVGSPTGYGTLNVRRVSDDVVLFMMGRVDVSTMTATSSVAFTQNATAIDNVSVYVSFEYGGGDASNYIRMVCLTGDGCAGRRYIYAGSWSSAFNFDVSGWWLYYTYPVYRSALMFDTTGVSDNGTVLYGRLGIWGSVDSSTTDFDVYVQVSKDIPACTYPHIPVDNTTDYDYTNYSGGYGGTFNTSTFTTANYNYIVFNSTELDYINSIGYTKFLLRSSRDMSNTSPSGNEYVTFNSTDASVHKPTLELVYTNGTVLTAATSSGVHSVWVSSSGSTASMYIDGSLASSSSIVGGSTLYDSGWDWQFMQGNVMPYADNISISINGTNKLLYGPVTLASTVTDRSGAGHTGTIVWGHNPTGIELTISGVKSFTDYVAATEEEALPDPLPVPNIPIIENTTKTGSNLPLHESFNATATSMGWTLRTTYGVFMQLASIAFGYGVMVALGGSVWGFIGGYAALGLFFASTGISPWWMSYLPILFIIFVAWLWGR